MFWVKKGVEQNIRRFIHVNGQSYDFFIANFSEPYKTTVSS